MRGRAERSGRHTARAGAPTAEPVAAVRHRRGSRARRRAADPVAIIGGSVVQPLAGRSRRRYASADVESSTAELPVTPGGRGRRVAGDGSSRRGVATSPRQPPIGSALALVRRWRQWGALVALGVTLLVAALGALLFWPTSAPAPPPVETTAAASPPSPVEPAPEEPVAAASADPAAAGAAGADARGEPDVQGYLRALGAADIPVSAAGEAETEAAQAICEQLDRGRSQADLERAVPAMLATVDEQGAPVVVELARKYYCA
jgi:hypothetical protein